MGEQADRIIEDNLTDMALESKEREEPKQTELRALTLKQPWAHAVFHYGKRIENRSWKPWDRIIGHYIAIHAGERYDAEGADWLFENGFYPPEHKDCPKGIVGVAQVTGYVEESDSIWFDGPYGWTLENVVPFRYPIAAKGAQGLWLVEPNLKGAVRMAHKAAFEGLNQEKEAYGRRIPPRKTKDVDNDVDNYILYNGKPPSMPVSTSMEAAEKALPTLRKNRLAIYRFIVGRGEKGATDSEMEQVLGLAHTTVSPRRRELVIMGYVCDSGKRRKTPSGRSAIVWVKGLQAEVEVGTQADNMIQVPKREEIALALKDMEVLLEHMKENSGALSHPYEFDKVQRWLQGIVDSDFSVS